MNKAVTDGIDLMPPAFSDGLSVWSSQDGLAGQATYQDAPNAALVAGDADFGDCLEIFKTDSVQQLRYTEQTAITPGCYLRVSARVKLVGGNRPSVRIAAYPLTNGGAEATVPTTGDAVFLETYGEVYEVSAIVGQGARGGVDLVWAQNVIGAHFGLDLIGDNNCSVRIESIVIEDATSNFLRNLMDWVDVRDYGAVGDGVTDDTDAFYAADAASAGRDLLVPEGEFYIGSELTLDARVRFTGKIAHSSPGRVALTHNYNYDTYLDAFQDEQIALERALGALYAFTDHDSLDLCGRQIRLTRPVDVHAAVGDRDTFGNRRAIRNGYLEAASSSAWNDATATSSASYDSEKPLELTDVVNVAQIEQGSLVEGTGVGREVYVREVDIPNAKLILSQPLYAAAGTQTYSFTRFRYMLDYSGFTSINRQCLMQIEFLCNRRASAVMLAQSGTAWHIHDCWFVRPKDRAITSIGEGCNGISIESNEFLSPDGDQDVGQRTSIAFNTNKNDMKIRNNRAVQFLHFAVVAGGGHLFVGNHWWQGDNAGEGAARSAGVVLTNKNVKTVFTGNYCDNAFIELTDEHNANTTNDNPYGNLTITGNIFTCSDVLKSFTYIRIAPIGANRYIDGISVTDNAFKTIGGDIIQRVDDVDTDRGTLDPTRTRGVTFTGNVYENVVIRTQNPAAVPYTKFGSATTWTVPTAGRLPFGLRALTVDGVSPTYAISSDWDGRLPRVAVKQGSSADAIGLTWPEPVGGGVIVHVRCDLHS